MSNHISIADRTKAFAVRIIKACAFLEKQSDTARTLSRQLLRSAANVREARSAESDKDFIHKLQVALKEAREVQLWLEILIESEIVKPELAIHNS